MIERGAVRVGGLGKSFKHYAKPHLRLVEWLTGGRVRRHVANPALQDLSFEIQPGECFGIIGENGAGKSTLLKILTGAMKPSAGAVQIGGRVLSLLELGTGFNPDMTGRANVHSTAVLLGFPHDALTDDKMNAIAAFADIGKYFDRPLRTYSTGMYVRLAFSMFMFMEPDVFIIDEALSVGDFFFAQKCFSRIRELIDRGVTFILVSHDLSAIQNLSDRVMVLQNGRSLFIGDPSHAVGRYVASKASPWAVAPVDPGVFRADSPAPHAACAAAETPAVAAFFPDALPSGVSRHGSGELYIASLRITGLDGQQTLSVSLGGVLEFHFLLRARRSVFAPRVGLALYDRMNNLVFGQNSLQLGVDLSDLKGGEELAVRMVVTMDVQPGEYALTVHCGEPGRGSENPNAGRPLDIWDGLGPIAVLFDYSKSLVPFNGMARLPVEVRL